MTVEITGTTTKETMQQIPEGFSVREEKESLHLIPQMKAVMQGDMRK